MRNEQEKREWISELIEMAGRVECEPGWSPALLQTVERMRPQIVMKVRSPIEKANWGSQSNLVWVMLGERGEVLDAKQRWHGAQTTEVLRELASIQVPLKQIQLTWRRPLRALPILEVSPPTFRYMLDTRGDIRFVLSLSISLDQVSWEDLREDWANEVGRQVF